MEETITVKIPKHVAWGLACYLDATITEQKKRYKACDAVLSAVLKALKSQNPELDRCLKLNLNASTPEERKSAIAETLKCGY